MLSASTAEQMYLEEPGRRPAFQGDVFDSVPFTKVGAGDTVESEPKWSATRRLATPILYPCDMVGDDNVSLLKSQPIARVYDAVACGLHVPENWQITGLCPLPDLQGDGRMWVADFRSITSVDRSYLRPDRRVRCLTEHGWAVFRQRLNLAGSRAVVDLADLEQFGRATWVESEMETRWLEAGRAHREFPAWLDAYDPEIPFESRRDALEAHAFEAVGVALEQELGK